MIIWKKSTLTRNVGKLKLDNVNSGRSSFLARLFDCLQFLCISPLQNDIVAFLGKQERRCCSDSSRASSNYCSLNRLNFVEILKKNTFAIILWSSKWSAEEWAAQTRQRIFISNIDQWVVHDAVRGKNDWLSSVQPLLPFLLCLRKKYNFLNFNLNKKQETRTIKSSSFRCSCRKEEKYLKNVINNSVVSFICIKNCYHRV